MLIFEMEFKGKTYYAHFSHYALTRSKLETGQELEEALGSVEGQEELMYHALVAGCKHQGVNHPSRKDVPFIIDGNMAKVEYMTLKSLQSIEEEKKKFGMLVKKQK